MADPPQNMPPSDPPPASGLEPASVPAQGQPGVWMRSDGLLSGLLPALADLLGPARLAQALLAAGQHDAHTHWPLLADGQPLAEAFDAWRAVMLATGQGDLHMLEHDQATQRVVVQAWQHWEGLIQTRLGRCWGSAVLMGQLAALCSRHFGRPCQARQTRFLAKGDSCDEFVVQPADGVASVAAVQAAEPPAAWSLAPRTPPAAALLPLRVMVVGLDAVNIELMRQLAAVLPAVWLDVAASGAQALLQARQAAPDLMLVDLPLGDMSAPEFARLLRTDPRTRAVRLVGLMGSLPPGHLAPPWSLGFVQVLTKPIDFSVMLPLLQASRRPAPG